MSITVKNLQDLLSEFDPDLPVRMYADHGQCDMPVDGADLYYTPEDLEETFMIETAYDSIQEAESEGWTKEELSVFVGIY